MKIKSEIKVFIMSCATYIVAGIFSTLTSALAAYFAGDVNMTPGIMGIFFSMGGLLTALAFTIPGRLVDKIGAKKALIIIAVGELLAIGLFGLARSAVGCMIFLSINCLVTAMSVPCNTQMLKALNVDNPSKLLRINLIGQQAAGMITAATAAVLIEKFGLSWRQTFFVYFAISVVIIVIGLVFLSSVKIDFRNITVTKKNDDGSKQLAKAYKYTTPERNSCISLCLLYIGYMGVGIALSLWMPAYLQGKGFTGMQVSIPNTIGRFAQMAAYLVLPSIAAKMLKTTKVTPFAAACLIFAIFGIMVSPSLTVISISRGLLAVVMGFISMHVQSDLSFVAPHQATGRFSSTVLACANAGGVIAVTLMGYLSQTSKLVMLLTFAALAIIGAVMFIKPYKEISDLKASAAAENA
ncbi:MAG: MFS transporter [Oscillospiraceae bacterium]